jgi:lysozyme
MPNAMVVDLSHHNTNINFAQMRAAGVAGVIHKATQGTGFVDDKYASRKQPALQAGLLWGAYHFGTGDDVNTQVDFFLKTVGNQPDTLLVLDFEKNTTPPGNSMTLAQAEQFLTTVENRTGRKPVFYTGSFLTDVGGSAAIPSLAQYRVWWARYSTTPHLHATWPNYWLWQYSDGVNGPDNKVVSGVGPCDCNTFSGNETDLQASWLA